MTIQQRQPQPGERWVNDGWGSWTFLEMRLNETDGKPEYVWRTDESGREFVTGWLYFTHVDDWKDRQLSQEYWIVRAKQAERRISRAVAAIEEEQPPSTVRSVLTEEGTT